MTPQDATLADITNNENLLVLVTRPGDESHLCGGLIAACCRNGRPPFVMVLGDGTSSDPAIPPDTLANQHDRETRAAILHLGLPPARLLMAGLYDNNLPYAGPIFDAVVRAVTLVMWARDCNVICAPHPEGNHPNDRIATHQIAATVAATSGVALLTITNTPSPRRLDITPQQAAKRAAMAVHTSLPTHTPPPQEYFPPPSPTSGRGPG